MGLAESSVDKVSEKLRKRAVSLEDGEAWVRLAEQKTDEDGDSVSAFVLLIVPGVIVIDADMLHDKSSVVDSDSVPFALSEAVLDP